VEASASQNVGGTTLVNKNVFGTPTLPN